MGKKPLLTFQELISIFQRFWGERGCVLHQPYDLEVGAGTFHPGTFLRTLGPEPWRTAYVQSCRRPGDGRYGENPNRLQQYYQYQVLLKPPPEEIQNIYLSSLKEIGLSNREHDIRFIHDDWESPTLGAWGLGWEVRLDGMEITQFTYFQEMGGIELNPISVEITYGLERIAMYLQNVDSVYDLIWSEGVLYGDIYHESEVQFSRYNFEEANIEVLKQQFSFCEAEALQLLEKGLVYPAYDQVMKCSHLFNLLESRGAISVAERTTYITRVRGISRRCAEAYQRLREEKGFPLLKSVQRREKAWKIHV